MLKSQRLKPFSLFGRLGEKRLDRIAGSCERRHFAKGQQLVLQGENPRAFFLIEYGKVKVYRSGSDGREKVLHIVEPWQSFGEVAVLSLEIYPASAEAIEDTAAIVVPVKPLLAMLQEDAALARAMLAGQAMWIRRLIDQNAALVLEDVATRLARYLVVYAEFHQIPMQVGALLDLDIKKSVIAAQIGTVPETLARNFKKLCDRGLLKRAGKGFEVRDAEGLNRMAYP